MALLFFVLANPLFATPPPHIHLEQADALVFQDKVKELGKKYGAENVLVVYDNDNTLLAMNQNLGSDQWFHWQETLLDDQAKGKKVNPRELVAQKFSGLVDVQGYLFALSEMHPPQPSLPKMVAEIQAEHFPSIILTSRGVHFRDSLERELERQGYHFASDDRKLPGNGFTGTYLPYSLENPEEFGLTKEEVAAWKLRAPLPVSYWSGIYMVTGQNKGAVLRTLLHRTKASYKAIAFLDDQLKHCERMQKAFEKSDLELLTVRYSAEDKNVAAFEKGNKRDEIAGWDALKSYFKKHLKGDNGKPLDRML